MWRRCYYILALLSVCASAWAVTQEGVVRTIARKDKPGQPVDGAVIRVRGSHNAVQSRTDGEFSLLLYNMENGDPYVLASIIKAGYEPAEQELVGKRIPCSDKVPLEILLVSRAQLMEEKEAIAAKARENVEIYYQERYSALEKQLQESRLTEAEFERRVQQLEGQYERFEPLLQTMSDKLARTDYERLDSLTALIQTAIESGNPEEAERLVREKGDLDAREAAIREREEQIAKAQQTLDEAYAQLEQQRALTAKDKKELAEDYYRLYASFLSRFQNDSADYYIRKRAALDTLNVDYQLQAGQFVRDIMVDLPAAQIYFNRAYRICQSQYSELSGQMATACSELGLLCKQQKEYDQALEWYQRSLTIREKIRGKNSLAVAEALNNLGELYRAQKDYKQAMDCHKRALKMREKLSGANSLEVAESKNNIAGIHFLQGQLDKAEQLFTEVKNIYAGNEKTPTRRLADNATNLGVTFFKSGKYNDALSSFEKALEIYTKVLGPAHPLTQNAAKLKQLCQKKIEKP